MNWQRRTSIFNGDFTCCSRNHTAISIENGVQTEIRLPCDKVRVWQMVEGLWDRKICHVAKMPAEVNRFLLWRLISHKQMMLVHSPEDVHTNDDESLKTVCDVVKKYKLMADGKEAFLRWHAWELDAHIQVSHQMYDMTCSQSQALLSYINPWRELLSHPNKLLVQVALLYMTAEGNLRMVRVLHQVP